MTTVTRALTNLQGKARYAIRIRAYNRFNVASAWSEVLEIQTGDPTLDSAIPNAPTNLIASFSGATLILSWTAPTTNTDNSPLLDFAFYDVSLTHGATTVTYKTTGPSFSYGEDNNIADFGSVQSSFTLSIVAVDTSGNMSAPLTGSTANGIPTDPVAPPTLVAAFTLIVITMTTNFNLDWGGYLLYHSTDSVTYTLLATLTNVDSYNHTVGMGETHYYKYKIVDKFGQVSAGYSPVGSITTHRALNIDGYQIIDNLAVLSNLVIGNGTTAGTIASWNYDPIGGSSGYIFDKTGAIFENGSISILGLGGFLSMDSTSFRAIYSGNTQLLVDSSGVYIGGNDSVSAEIYVNPSTQQTFIQGKTLFQSAGGNYTFSINSNAQTTGSKILRLYDSFGVDSFYLTNDGNAYFAKGSIGLGGSSAFHVDSAGNMWLGDTTFGAAPFSVSAAGALKATSATITGAITGSSISGTTISGGSISGTSISGGSINIGSGAFIVDGSGNLSATSATITGGSLNINGNFMVNSSGVLSFSSGSRFLSDDFSFFNSSGSLTIARFIHTSLGGGHYKDFLGLGASGALGFGFYYDSNLNQYFFPAAGNTPSWNFTELGVDGSNGDSSFMTLYGTLRSYKDNNGDWGHMGVRSTGRVSGQAGMAFHNEADNTAGIIQLWGPGNYLEARNSANTAWVDFYYNGHSPSSLQFKKEVRELGSSVLDKIKTLKPIRYKHAGRMTKADGTELDDPGAIQSYHSDHLSLAAEEVAQHFPEVIGWKTDDKGKPQPYGIETMGMITLLWKAVQELSDQITTLKK